VNPTISTHGEGGAECLCRGLGTDRDRNHFSGLLGLLKANGLLDGNLRG
jgi:hypothetical protein